MSITRPIILAAFLSISIAAVLPSAAQAAVFGSREARYDTLAFFPKWTGMLQRARTGQIGKSPLQQRSGGCKPNPRFLCPQAEWNSFVEDIEARSLKGRALLNAVNTHLNKAPYVQDPINWGVPDYWSHIAEFFDRNGDCEDYAISKFATLKRLGVPNEQMRIVVLEDLNLDLAHAVLIVELDGNIYVLDNQIRTVVSHKTIRHYKPVYSINETHWWMHAAD